VRYPVETFTDDERARLARHVTNLDRPVYALVNLPETVKGALFARYSRYQGTLRRLFLDEFADSAPTNAVWEGPRRVRVGLQRPHQGPAASAPGRLPRAVHPVHPV
jgi:hypothetical protein